MARPAYHEQLDTLDVMIDIETMGTSDDTVILSIGAILFNPHTDEALLNDEGEIICPQFYSVLHKETQRGRTIDVNTQQWWDHPDRAEAKAQIENFPHKQHAVQALDELWDFMSKGPNGEKVNKGWGCAPSFDQSIIGHANKMFGIPKLKGKKMDLPVAFWNEMDVRTIETFVFGKKYRSEIRSGTYHNALDDCVTQAMMVRDAAKVVAAGRAAMESNDA